MRRFANIFGLDEAESIALLDTPQSDLAEDDSRYVAASQLANFPSEASIDALIRAINNLDPSLDNRITRRKAVESLGKLKAERGMDAICSCLDEDDTYTVENAVWAIGEIGTQDPEILERIANILTKPNHSYRAIVHTLAKLQYQPAIDRIKPFTEHEDPTIASAALSAACQLSGDYTQIDRVMAFLQHPNVYARRLCIQDLIDTNYYQAIPAIAQAPVSLVFRLRGIKSLAAEAIASGQLSFAQIRSPLEDVLSDRPQTLTLVHAYDTLPTLEFLIRELYEVDFGRCYLASHTLLEHYPDTAGAALLSNYQQEGYNDYGAHYHIIKLWGWLKYAPAGDLILEALNNLEPQFQKSRAAAALALAELGDDRAIDPIIAAALAARNWDLRYVALMALDRFPGNSHSLDLTNDADWLVKARATAT
jgi:bilin biosynthesis protein